MTTPTTSQPKAFDPPEDLDGLRPAAVSWNVAWVVAGLVVALWLFRYIFRRLRVKDPPAVAQPAEPREPIQTTLVKRLRGLEPQIPFEQREREEFFFALSMVLREVIEFKSGLRLTDMTYKEIEETLPEQRTPLGDDELREVLEFLKKADQIKFAGKGLGVIEADADKEKVVGWVRVLLGGALI